MAELIMVRSLLEARDDDGYPVALYEADPAHPANAAGKHEAFVAGPDPVQVARTGLVNRRITDGALEIVESRQATTERPVRPRTTAPRPELPPETAGVPFGGITAEQGAALKAAGYGSIEAVQGATDEELLAVPGIGPAAVEKLRDATKE